MREHQIVITLKPEQFLQVQKLARNAGAKSMGMFVRQQLLQALGIEGQQPESAKADLEPVVSELKRLHYELKEFVAESLSTYSVPFDLEKETDAVPVELQSGLPFVTEDPSLEERVDDGPGDSPAKLDEPEERIDEMEQAAAKAFSISPRLGVDESAVQAISTKPELAGPGSGPMRNLWTGFKPSETDPRRDPLSELLSADEVQSTSNDSLIDDPDDDSFDVPLSILARRQQLAQQVRGIEDKDDSRQTGVNRDAPSIPPQKPDKPDLSDESKKNSSGNEDKPKTTGAQDISGAYSKYAPLENPDDDVPFSGGPPPKKRQ